MSNVSHAPENASTPILLLDGVCIILPTEKIGEPSSDANRDLDRKLLSIVRRHMQAAVGDQQIAVASSESHEISEFRGFVVGGSITERNIDTKIEGETYKFSIGVYIPDDSANSFVYVDAISVPPCLDYYGLKEELEAVANANGRELGEVIGYGRMAINLLNTMASITSERIFRSDPTPSTRAACRLADAVRPALMKWLGTSRLDFDVETIDESRTIFGLSSECIEGHAKLRIILKVGAKKDCTVFEADVHVGTKEVHITFHMIARPLWMHAPFTAEHITEVWSAMLSVGKGWIDEKGLAKKKAEYAAAGMIPQIAEVVLNDPKIPKSALC